MAIEKRIYKKDKNIYTTFDFVAYEPKAIWGINVKGEYKAFSKKYYKVVEVDSLQDLMVYDYY